MIPQLWHVLYDLPAIKILLCGGKDELFSPILQLSTIDYKVLANLCMNVLHCGNGHRKVFLM